MTKRRESKRREKEKEGGEEIEKDGQRSTTADEWMMGGERMEGIFKKVLNFPPPFLSSAVWMRKY